MKSGQAIDVIHKEVVVVGNGPSGIALSYMLSGNIPYLISDEHPDEILAARLRPSIGQALVREDLHHLAEGLEGRSTNPVSLLLDCLIHPCADIGLEMEPLVEWRKDGAKIDHIVLGKGPPGGSWHSMDPHILTLSLGSWMGLPGLPYTGRDSTEKRAFAANIAAYYEQYVNKMDLTENFKTGIVVTNVKYIANDQTNKNKWVHRIDSDICARKKFCIQPEKQEQACSWSSVFNSFLLRAQKKYKPERCCKRPRDCFGRDDSPERKMREVMCDTDIYLERIAEGREDSEVCPKCLEKTCRCRPRRYATRSISCSNDSENLNQCDMALSRSYNDRSYLLRNSVSLDLNQRQVPSCEESLKPRWIVEAFDLHSKTHLRYSCKYLVLANGTSDLPNRLGMKTKLKEDPHWLLHDLKSLEIELDLYLQEDPSRMDPVLIVGAGLSAADAVIATRGRNIPVIHVFRNKSASLNKQLPENMYPEYHKVHQMMRDGGSTYSLYTAMPEYTLTDVSSKDRIVTLTSSEGKTMELRISFAVVLIGSRPDLRFLPQNFKLGVKKDAPIDSKNNTVDINKLNHMVNGFEGLYAIGPLAGDNFVRFLPGGALAIVSDLYQKYSY